MVYLTKLRCKYCNRKLGRTIIIKNMMRQGKDYNKPSFKKQNKVVAFVKDKRFLKIQICLLHCETSIGIY